MMVVSAFICGRGFAVGLLFLVVCSIIAQVSAREGIYDTTGVLMLDDITFPKVVPNNNYNVLVLIANKFKVGQPLTDDIRETYFQFSEDCIKDVVPELMFSQILVNGGENSALAGRIGVKNPTGFEVPQLYLFKKGESKGVLFPASASFDNKGLSAFLEKNAGLKLQAPGLTNELEVFVSRFANNDAERAEIAKEAAAFYADNTNEHVDVYLKTMQKIVEKGIGYAATESARIAGLLNNPKDNLPAKKRSELKTKGAIINYFSKLLA